MAASTATLVELHMHEAKGYLRQMDDRIPHDCVKYWEDHGAVTVEPMHQEFANNGCERGDLSGFVFPALDQFRKDITFDVTEKFDCNKLYVASKRFTPGILTVQCCCDKPQLLGYIVMVRCESTALALTSILTNFQVPPRVVYYDNGCNLVRSVLTRAPWLMHTTKFVVDRFHFKSHTCCIYYDPDSYPWMDEDRSTTAESINARIEKTVPFIRYVKGENLIPFLNIRFALLNIATRYRRQYATDDLEDADLWQFFRNTVQCACLMCTEQGAEAILARDEREYVYASDTDNSDVAEEQRQESDQGPATEPDANNSPAADGLEQEDSEDEREAMVVDSEAVQLDAPDSVVTETAILRGNVPTMEVELLDE